MMLRYTLPIRSYPALHHAGSIVSKDVIEWEWLGVIKNSSALTELYVEVLILDVTLNNKIKLLFTGSADEGKILNNTPQYKTFSPENARFRTVNAQMRISAEEKKSTFQGIMQLWQNRYSLLLPNAFR